MEHFRAKKLSLPNYDFAEVIKIVNEVTLKFTKLRQKIQMIAPRRIHYYTSTFRDGSSSM
jgi:hypothetical protein